MASGDDRPPGLWPIRLVFLAESVTFGAWLPRIPDVKEALLLDPGALGLALAGFPAGSMLGFLVAGRFTSAVGGRRACAIAGAAFALAFIPVGWAASLLTLFVALALCGVAVALIEVAMSTKAGQYENLAGRRVMSQCHGFWSIGSVVGALLGGVLSQAEIAPALQFAMLNPVLAIATVLVALRTPADPVAAAGDATGFVVLPGPALVLLCLMPVGIMAVEGAAMDWSAVFVRDVLAAEPFAAASAYAVFSTMMAIVRLSGDRLAERHGAPRVVLVASLTAAVGVGLVATAPTLPVLLVGTALMGMGVAPVFPLALSAAAAAPGSTGANVAAATFIAFAVFLASPPFMGGLAELFGLRVAFAVLVPLALVSAALSRAAGAR